MIHSFVLILFGPCEKANEKPAICFEFGIAAFSLYGSDLEDDPPIRCISRHRNFETVCLRSEVLETAIVGLNQARGIRAPRELENVFVPHLRHFKSFYSFEIGRAHV